MCIRDSLGGLGLGEARLLHQDADHIVHLQQGGVALVAHHPEVDGPEGQLGQDSGQDRRDLKHRVQRSRDQARQHPGESGQHDRQERIHAPVHNQHRADTAAQREAAVHLSLIHI